MNKELLKHYIYYCIVLLVVIYGWRLLEIIMIGHINPNSVDSVVSLILTLSLYFNLMHLRQRLIHKNTIKRMKNK